MRLKLFLSVLFFCAITKAQTTLELKDFINKNNVAIRNVQKNMVRENNSSFASSFKELLKDQEAAIKLFNSDKKTSFYFASLVRKNCLDFLKSHSQGASTKYFDFTTAENNFQKSNAEVNTNILSSSDINFIDNMDVLSPQSLNNITLTIQ